VTIADFPGEMQAHGQKLKVKDDQCSVKIVSQSDHADAGAMNVGRSDPKIIVDP
jgi:hypothetical protein